jgi:hypothetical protein
MRSLFAACSGVAAPCTRPLVPRRGAMAVLAMSTCSVAMAQAGSGQTDVLDAKALPLGDGRISYDAKRGYAFACSTQFRTGGAWHAGDWIQGSTWDATRKVWVQGDVRRPDARFDIVTTAQQRVLTGNALPLGHATGRFPVAHDDPAFQFDRNPNTIAAQALSFTLRLQPALAGRPSCVSMGVIGVALNGVPIFNALDAAGRDAVAHEVQDRCQGHPQGRGVYYHHGPIDCLPGNSGNSVLDGFGIYSGHDDIGREITNADLDECHGQAGHVLWNGERVAIYHYVMTREVPYTLGCYRGAAVGRRMAPTAASSPDTQRERRAGAARPATEAPPPSPARIDHEPTRNSWISADGTTWDATAKIAVPGAVQSLSQFIVQLTGSTRSVTGNGLPSHTTGTFPIAATDPARAWDGNPNANQAVALALGAAGQPALGRAAELHVARQSCRRATPKAWAPATPAPRSL